jgi:Spy/CpxP family protein refolding chaperone
MNRKTRYLYLVLVACFAVDASAQDAIQALLIQPELIMQNREQLKLSDKQAEQLRAKVEAAGPESQELKQRSDKAMGKLAEFLSADQVDEAATLRQLDEVIAAESDQKRLHMRVMIQVRNLLSAEQLQMAKKLQASSPNPTDVEQRLRAKLDRIQKAVQKLAQAGEQPFEVVGLMQKLPELMKAGRIDQAEALLDRVLVKLGLEKKSAQRSSSPATIARKAKRLQQRAQQMAQNGEDVSKIQEVMQKIGPLLKVGKVDEAGKLIDEALELMGNEPPEPDKSNDKPTAKTSFLKQLTPPEVRAEVAALAKEDVPWRKIAWKTCLLDGLQASQEQDKPVVLWIFIDRPIDDERC